MMDPEDFLQDDPQAQAVEILVQWEEWPKLNKSRRRCTIEDIAANHLHVMTVLQNDNWAVKKCLDKMWMKYLEWLEHVQKEMRFLCLDFKNLILHILGEFVIFNLGCNTYSDEIIWIELRKFFTDSKMSKALLLASLDTTDLSENLKFNCEMVIQGFLEPAVLYEDQNISPVDRYTKFLCYKKWTELLDDPYWVGCQYSRERPKGFDAVAQYRLYTEVLFGEREFIEQEDKWNAQVTECSLLKPLDSIFEWMKNAAPTDIRTIKPKRLMKPWESVVIGQYSSCC